MKFLGKGKAPMELPDLAIESGSQGSIPPKADFPANGTGAVNGSQDFPKPIVSTSGTHIIPSIPKSPAMIGESLNHMPLPKDTPKKVEVPGEDYLEFNSESEKTFSHEDIRKKLNSEISEIDDAGEKREGFFDHFIEDINGEIKDLGKLEEWYNNKFLPQDVVSNMRAYWEDNKADVIIENFGREYKEKINHQIKNMQNLELDWREIYFKLVKKEEEMKHEERILKETLSDFVDLCKRRKLDEASEKSKKRK